MSDVLTAKQAAEFLQLSPETVKAKARAGLMPAAKVGREWRFSRRQLLAWIEAGGTIPEELVDQGIIAVVEERMAREDEARVVPWEEDRRRPDERLGQR